MFFRDGAHEAGSAIVERAVIPAWQPGTARRQRRGVWLEVGLTAAAHVLRNRRFREALAVGGMVLVALTHMSWKVLARIVRDLIAWDNARLADLENQLHRQRTTQAPDGAVLEGAVIPPRQPEASNRQRRAVWLGVGLTAGAHVLRNRRLDEQVVVFIFALAALVQMSGKELARAVMDQLAASYDGQAG